MKEKEGNVLFNDALNTFNYGYMVSKKIVLQLSKTAPRPEPEATSIGRASRFIKAVVDHYFTLFEELIDTNELTAERIFNVDGSDISTVQR